MKMLQFDGCTGCSEGDGRRSNVIGKLGPKLRELQIKQGPSTCACQRTPAYRYGRLINTSMSKPEEMSRKSFSLQFLYRDILQMRKLRVKEAKYLGQVPEPGWNPGILPLIEQQVSSQFPVVGLCAQEQAIKIVCSFCLNHTFPRHFISSDPFLIIQVSAQKSPPWGGIL